MHMLARPLAFGLAVLLAASSASAMSRRPARPTLLVVPERYSVMQVAFDVLAKREAVVVSYRGSLDAPELHAWSGTEWVAVPMARFSDASFLRIVPRETLLVGDEETLPPVLKESVSSWCRKVWLAESAATGDLVNTLGRVLNFSEAEWQWFAARFKLDITDINEARRRDSWYYHPFVEDRGGLPAPVEEALQAPAPTPEPVADSTTVEPVAEDVQEAKPRVSMPAPTEPVVPPASDDEPLK